MCDHLCAVCLRVLVCVLTNTRVITRGTVAVAALLLWLLWLDGILFLLVVSNSNKLMHSNAEKERNGLFLESEYKGFNCSQLKLLMKKIQSLFHLCRPVKFTDVTGH